MVAMKGEKFFCWEAPTQTNPLQPFLQLRYWKIFQNAKLVRFTSYRGQITVRSLIRIKWKVILNFTQSSLQMVIVHSDMDQEEPIQSINGLTQPFTFILKVPFSVAKKLPI